MIQWIEKRDGHESIVATDRFSFTFNAGRVLGNRAATLTVKAIYANEIKSHDIAITIRDDIPEPVFTLAAPEN